MSWSKGAAGGLGLNFASACAQAGANVAAMDVASVPPKDFALLEKMDARVKYYQ